MGGESSKGSSSGEIENIKSNTHFHTKEIEEWHEKFYQDFPDGFIREQEFVEMYKQIFTAGDSTAFARHVFKAYDTDGNGRIDFMEFMVTLSISSRGSPDEKLHWAFTMYDLDKNGKISRDEAAEIMTAIFQMKGEFDKKKMDDAVDKIFVHLDKNKNAALSEEEFIAGAMQSPSIMEVLQGGSS